MAESPRTWTFAGLELPVFELNTLVVGSGAAARRAALSLLRLGQRDVAMVTEAWNAGTSFNAGSDKQTYYKISVAGEVADSPRELAADLFAGGCMHGDIALCEAQHSAQAFFNLVELGVPFPHDRFGGYVGYQTDFDSRRRATSAGPLTSKIMCDCLGRALEQENVRVFDNHLVISLLTRPVEGGHDEQTSVCGVVAIDKQRLDDGTYGLVVFNALNVVLATGGPGGLYGASVYPQSQLGGTGMALTAGAIAHNLTESQFGIASVGFRWNLSGSYQQVIPRYISTTADGKDEREFLNDFFPDLRTLTLAIFRKGYEWPFDADRVLSHGSSLIDLLVHRETVDQKRRVFLDYTNNPSDPLGKESFELESLDPEVIAYLSNSEAKQTTPITRLMAMNSPAVDLFREHGIDLESERLEIAVCAQHNNGGLRANEWWESNVKHLFPIGEVCGTHGVRRPGGAALNAGQVGAIRAAHFASHNYGGKPPRVDVFVPAVLGQVENCVDFCAGVTRAQNQSERCLLPKVVLAEIQSRMTRTAAQIREPTAVAESVKEAWALCKVMSDDLRVSGPLGLPMAFRVKDLCLTHAVYLEAIDEYLRAGGQSRGGMLVLDRNGTSCGSGLDDGWRYAPSEPGGNAESMILEVAYRSVGEVDKRWVDVRPIPEANSWFESVWAEYRCGDVYSISEEEGRG